MTPGTHLATIHLTGDVHSSDFPGWIAHHAHKLGLSGIATKHVQSGLEISARGAEEMLHALALGASLGPQSVLVDTIEITTVECAAEAK